VWLVNTGWSGGSFGIGSRVRLKYSRAILDAIHNGARAGAPTTPDPTFGFAVVTEWPDVPSEILVPRDTWADKHAYDQAARMLAHRVAENFKHFERGVSPAVKAAAPSMEEQPRSIKP
jgi:phosphoenolpyruvate carboxykinase (ATP)